MGWGGAGCLLYIVRLCVPSQQKKKRGDGRASLRRFGSTDAPERIDVRIGALHYVVSSVSKSY